MPNIKSAEKRVLIAEENRLRNRAVKSELKTELKKFDAAVNEGNSESAEKAYKVAAKAVDQAAANGVIHKNNAANKKSAMAKKLNSLKA